MTTNEISNAMENGITLMWNDPDYVMGNDYRITSIELGEEISGICYNNGQSEAEVFNSEISIAPERVTKKEFKECSQHTVYSGRGIRINAFFYGYDFYRWKYMVWSPVELSTKKELFDMFYEWVINHKPLEDHVRYRMAKNNTQMFKIPISL
jgi:hypothetical protein